MINGLDHIAIAVADLDSSITTWEKVLGGRCTYREVVSEQCTEVAMIELGDLRIELIAPTSPGSPVSKSLEKRGPGLHHIAISVSDVLETLTQIKSNGGALIDEVPRVGAHDTRVAFLHPKSLGGVLVELVEYHNGK